MTAETKCETCSGSGLVECQEFVPDAPGWAPASKPCPACDPPAPPAEAAEAPEGDRAPCAGLDRGWFAERLRSLDFCHAYIKEQDDEIAALRGALRDVLGEVNAAATVEGFARTKALTLALQKARALAAGGDRT